ncbi:MAG TPA: ABC-type transport auxiliary lipoprotein family protein [Steroidobacteraceae bacterium]|nr:ABC-type transport auxiliary lipoprotein family protein [Steroidobacteraceae bacterium]
MNPTWQHLRRVAPILLVLGVAGCSGLLHSNAPPVQVYTLRPGAASAGGTADSSHPAMVVSLRVGHPLAGPGLGSSQIVLLQPDHRMNVYAASAWSADVPALVESLAAQTLRASGDWRSVEDNESPFPSDYLLQISISRFDADYSAGTGVPPTIHVTLDCTLGTEDGRTILATFAADGSAAAGANKLSEVVAAFQQATDQALGSMSSQAIAAVSATGVQRAKGRSLRPR